MRPSGWIRTLVAIPFVKPATWVICLPVPLNVVSKAPLTWYRVTQKSSCRLTIFRHTPAKTILPSACSAIPIVPNDSGFVLTTLPLPLNEASSFPDASSRARQEVPMPASVRQTAAARIFPSGATASALSVLEKRTIDIAVLPPSPKAGSSCHGSAITMPLSARASAAQIRRTKRACENGSATKNRILVTMNVTLGGNESFTEFSQTSPKDQQLFSESHI